VRKLLIDFHSHTTASDGALSPRELIDRALAANLSLFAITDHDTMAGYRAAAEYYTHNPGEMRLIPGVEFSCRWSGTTIHMVGLGVDELHPAMEQGLSLLARARVERGKKIGDRLAAKGFSGAYAGASEKAGESQLGRPHFAAWMIEQGHVRDFNQAFDKYLGQGKIGDVKAFWPELAEVTEWIVASGGVAVIAHPLKYRFTRMKLRRMVSDFKAAGGLGIEVLNGRQTPDQTSQLKRLALEFELEISGGSDFHRDSTYSPKLGVELRQMGSLRGVWQRWTKPAQEEGSKA
jgi:predicted metal-dependent phosphoesterase TrpH